MAKIKQQLVDTNYIKLNSTVEYNVDDSKLNPNIFKAQDLHLQGVLNSDFMNHLMEAVYNETTNADEDELIEDYIKPMLCEWTVAISLEFLRNKITNKSVSNEYSNYSSSADRANVIDLINTCTNWAEFYTQRLIKYLCDNSNLFPLYVNPTEKVNMKATEKPYFNGLYIPRKRGCGC